MSSSSNEGRLEYGNSYRMDKVPPISYSGHSLSSIASHDEFYKSHNHAEDSLAKMNLYLVNNQLTDVTLIAGGTEVKAHRLVLCAASEYFDAMFNGDLREARESEVHLHEVDGEALSELVSYCYTGRIELREDSVETLLVAASLLQLCKVVEACSVFLRKQLHPSNCIGIALFADSQSCIELKNAATKYISEYFVEVVKNQEFLLLPTQEVAKLLESEDLNVHSEEVIFQSLMTWFDHDRKARKNDLQYLLSFVKLPLLSPEFLVDQVEPLVGKECHGLVLEALKYHLLPERRAAIHSFRTKPRKSTVGLLYAVGGMERSKAGATSIEVYDPRKDTWSQVTCMPGKRLQFGVAAIGNTFYVMGGRDGLKTLDSVECFDLESKTWSCLPPMLTHRHGLGVGVIGEGGPLYVVGGHDGWSYLNTVERWDPQLKQWTYVAPMMTQRSTVGVAVLNNKLYAVGGRDGCSCLRTVEVYDPHTNKWNVCAPMSKRRAGVGVCAMDNYLYAFGGHDIPTINPSAARFSCVERYDPSTDTWTTVSPMSVGRDAIGVGRLGEDILAVGGYDGQSCLKLVEAYNPYTNSWRTVGCLNTGRAGACVVVIKERPPS